MRQINRFALCETFKCSPDDLERWAPQDVEDFMNIMSVRAQIQENKRRVAERG